MRYLIFTSDQFIHVEEIMHRPCARSDIAKAMVIQIAVSMANEMGWVYAEYHLSRCGISEETIKRILSDRAHRRQKNMCVIKWEYFDQR
jgi:hypothetical protein